MSTKSEKLAKAKARSAANTAKKAKTNSKSSSKSSKSSSGSSFNPASIGISQSEWDSWGPGVQNIVSTLYARSNVLAEKGTGIPDLSEKTLKKYWDEAEKDPTIKKYYDQQLQVGTKTLQDNMYIQAADYQQSTDKEKQDYVNAKKQLDATSASTGQVYSGFRTQAQKELDKSAADVIASSRATAQQNLNQAQSDFEQKYGSSALAGMNVGTLAAGTTSPTGSQSNWTLPSTSDISYTPVGGLAGSNAGSKLSDIEDQYQSNIKNNSSNFNLNNAVKEYKSLQGMA
jgi:hypothetical protein